MVSGMWKGDGPRESGHLDGLNLKAAMRDFGGYVSMDKGQWRALAPGTMHRTLCHSVALIVMREIELLKNQFLFLEIQVLHPISGHSELRRNPRQVPSLSQQLCSYVFIMHLLKWLELIWKSSAHRSLPRWHRSVSPSPERKAFTSDSSEELTGSILEQHLSIYGVIFYAYLFRKNT